MAKTTKTTQTSKAAETRAVAEKAAAEKRAAIRQSGLYGRMSKAVEAAIAEAAKDGRDGIALPAVKVPGELGSPDSTVGDLVVGCDRPRSVVDALAEDLEAQGYEVLRLLGCPIAVAWPKSAAE